MKNRNRQNTFSALVQDVIDQIKNYITLKVEFISLTLAEKVSILIARIVLMFFMAMLCLAVLLLLFLLIYTLLMSWIGIPWLVVLIELGLLVLCAILLWVFKQPLVIRPVASMIIREIASKSDDEKEEE